MNVFRSFFLKDVVQKSGMLIVILEYSLNVKHHMITITICYGRSYTF